MNAVVQNQIINPEQLTSVVTGSSETETIITAAVNALIAQGASTMRDTFTWKQVAKELAKTGMDTYDDFYWFRTMVFGRNAEASTTENGTRATSRYPNSQEPDDTGKIFVMATPSEVTKATFRKVLLALGDKVEVINETELRLKDDSN